MQNQNLCRLRIVVGRFFVIWLWAHVAVLALVGLANGSHWLAATVTGAAAAGIATAAWLYDREGPLVKRGQRRTRRRHGFHSCRVSLACPTYRDTPPALSRPWRDRRLHRAA